MPKCIWCKEEHGNFDKEHIIPEALGGSENFVLSQGEVCKSCNNNLAHLDQVVADDYDFITFTKGVLKKDKKLPEIKSRGNAIGYQKPGERVISFNLDKKHNVSIDGFSVAPYSNRERNIKASFGGNEVKFKFEIGKSPKFARGIIKISFSSIVYFLGPSLFLENTYDPIRDYVISGKGNRSLLLFPPEDEFYKHEIKLIEFNLGCYGIYMRLGCLYFLVDLTPNMEYFETLRSQSEKMWGKEGWTYLPVH